MCLDNFLEKCQENELLAEKWQDRHSRRTGQKKRERRRERGTNWQPWDSRQEDDIRHPQHPFCDWVKRWDLDRNTVRQKFGNGQTETLSDRNLGMDRQSQTDRLNNRVKTYGNPRGDNRGRVAAVTHRTSVICGGWNLSSAESPPVSSSTISGTAKPLSLTQADRHTHTYAHTYPTHI